MPPTPKPAPSYYSGRVHSVNFSDESKAFYVLRVALDAECVTGAVPSNIVTARGDIPGVKIAVGTWFGFEAAWDDHPKYGRQLKITRAPVLKNGWDDETCEKILTSHGIGAALAAKLREAFRGDMPVALADPERLKTVPGITAFVADHIAHKWRVARSQFLTLDFLGDLGLPQGKIRQVWSSFGDRAQDVLSTDPWSLLGIDGITFQDCDTVALRLGLDCSPSNLNRVKGAVLHASKSSKRLGHLYLSSGELLGAVRPLDPLMTDRDIASGLKSLMDDKQVVVDRGTSPGVTAIYDPWSYETENGSAALLRERITSAAIPPDRAARYAKALLGEEVPDMTLGNAGYLYLSRVGSNLGISLSVTQTGAVLNALTESVSIITGLPGSGKTTSLRMALTLLHEAGIQPLVVAPTGIAAKRVASVTGVTASTIHRAFKAKGIESEGGRESTYAGVVGDRGDGSLSDGSDEEWGYGPGKPHPAEVVVIDESSMVDQAVLYRILTCTRPDTRLVFVGDAAQLPSVGAGNVLRDLIASGRFPTVALTEIFRQADTSPIVTAAHDIFHGRVPEAPVKSDFSLLPLSDEGEVLKTVLSLSEKLYGQRANFQVLSPRHAGTLGVTNLNTRLRELINPSQHGLNEVTLGGETLREGDRVIVCKNDYKLGVFNGDVAKVNFIDKNAKEIELKIHGPPVVMVRIPLPKARNLLRLAYAVTVHRMQGLEYDVVVMPLVEGFAHQLQRNLFYTAITRAKKKVLLVGTHRAMERAVKNNREDARNTLFEARLRA
jgi:exodeoxyribonuclease V alpha subunit